MAEDELLRQEARAQDMCTSSSSGELDTAPPTSKAPKQLFFSPPPDWVTSADPPWGYYPMGVPEGAQRQMPPVVEVLPLRAASDEEDSREGSSYSGAKVGDRKEGFGTYRLSDGSTFRGQWHDDMPHGRGVFITAEGSRLEGTWINNVVCGDVVYTEPDGTKYTGRCENNKKHGFGTMTLPNHATYVGQWAADKAHGKGTFKSALSGTSYAGEWQQGYPWGSGVMRHSDGSIYSGDFKAGVKHGRGRIQYSDGSCYDGEWRNGVGHGSGVYTAADSSSYRGFWRGGIASGKKSYYYNATTGVSYRGEFTNGHLGPSGKARFPDGATYEGHWKNGAAHGEGSFWLPDRKLFRGLWRNGGLTGAGVLISIETYLNGVLAEKYENIDESAKLDEDDDNTEIRRQQSISDEDELPVTPISPEPGVKGGSFAELQRRLGIDLLWVPRISGGPSSYSIRSKTEREEYAKSDSNPFGLSPLTEGATAASPVGGTGQPGSVTCNVTINCSCKETPCCHHHCCSTAQHEVVVDPKAARPFTAASPGVPTALLSAGPERTLRPCIAADVVRHEILPTATHWRPAEYSPLRELSRVAYPTASHRYATAPVLSPHMTRGALTPMSLTPSESPAFNFRTRPPTRTTSLPRSPSCPIPHRISASRRSLSSDFALPPLQPPPSNSYPTSSIENQRRLFFNSRSSSVDLPPSHPQPPVEVRYVPHEKVIEIPQVVERVVHKEIPGPPTYVERPEPQMVQTVDEREVPCRIPVTLESVTEVLCHLPQLTSRYTTVNYPVLIPRFIEVPVAEDLFDAETLERARQVNVYLDQLVRLPQGPGGDDIDFLFSATGPDVGLFPQPPEGVEEMRARFESAVRDGRLATDLEQVAHVLRGVVSQQAPVVVDTRAYLRNLQRKHDVVAFGYSPKGPPEPALVRKLPPLFELAHSTKLTSETDSLVISATARSGDAQSIEDVDKDFISQVLHLMKDDVDPVTAGTAILLKEIALLET